MAPISLKFEMYESYDYFFSSHCGIKDLFGMKSKISAGCLHLALIGELVKSRISDGVVKSPRSRLANPEK